jgi:hypothetical protein
MNSFLPANARKEKIVKPLGATSPWVWSLEPTHGCNLRCGHCNCRLDPLPKTYDFMGEETWRKAWAIIARTAPTCRVDLCVGGEPTLNESLPDFLKIAREISPRTQIQITTNGTMIASGHVTYKQLLDAGANIVYTDMYSPAELFHRLADESGYPSYEYYNPPPQAPSPWTYWGPQLKMIVLQEQPENWPETRFRAGLLGTWYNHLDWQAAARFGLKPVEKPIARRCNQPFLYVTVDSKGNYLLCCQDNTGETSGLWHHEVDYRVFRHNRLRLKHGVEIPSEADDYGMRLAVVS